MFSAVLRTALGTRLRGSLQAFRIPAARISEYDRMIIGNREVVGFGSNGQPRYMDNSTFPFPAVRWKEPTAEIRALREKEKGDWKNLTKDEKKQLYRASFRQTFTEMHAPTGEWKTSWAIALVLISVSLWLSYFLRTVVSRQVGMPESFSKESRELQFRRMLDLQVNPITGLSSKWDYERDTWKSSK
ncbi:cytochrome c oxidase subunit 4 isoform 1, mitochondrial-like [Cylas formicarius]|uniref:cytochrome c oxidase subunit 4 isoform 1, mitochondrial-like n=1 Tax=Cylas formicarius TaxID=197179 RepID=UPI002958BF4F|nr:cytochrome c oxidase subunit 4 isoform 1, mitochondrial-like [Cylas formicarius]